jgi:hypothetical protein
VLRGIQLFAALATSEKEGGFAPASNPTATSECTESSCLPLLPMSTSLTYLGTLLNGVVLTIPENPATLAKVIKLGGFRKGYHPVFRRTSMFETAEIALPAVFFV